MSAIQTPKQVINNHKKIMAKMVHAFIIRAVHQEPAKVLEIYKSFQADWERRCWNVHEKYGKFILSFDLWDREWKENGYGKFISIPVPKQLPEAERKQLLEYKKELIRLVYIVEEKTEHQRQRRETLYKIVFVQIRLKLWIKAILKSIWHSKIISSGCIPEKKKPIEGDTIVPVVKHQMSVSR